MQLTTFINDINDTKELYDKPFMAYLFLLHYFSFYYFVGIFGIFFPCEVKKIISNKIRLN